MDTKLTLKLDRLIIENAKEYASEKGISLSKIVEYYLQALTDTQGKDIKISPLVNSLIGVIPDNDLHNKKGYSDYLSEKYK